jgi:hypothetical protein
MPPSNVMKTRSASLDHLIGDPEQLVGNGQAERFGGLEDSSPA